mgnify:CR=1 FL=1
MNNPWEMKEVKFIEFVKERDRLRIEISEDKLYFGVRSELSGGSLACGISWEDAREIKRMIEIELFVRRIQQ